MGQLRSLRRGCVMASRIVGMDDDYGARFGGARRGESGEIDLPAVIVEKRIPDELYVAQIGEKIEEGITRSGNQNFVAGIAQKTEYEGIGLAGSGSQHQAVDAHREFLCRVIREDRLAR